MDGKEVKMKTKEEVINEMDELPEKIRMKIDDLNHALNMKDQAVSEIIRLKLQIGKGVFFETDSEGKKLYTNETSRKAESEERLLASNVYMDSQEKHEKFKRKELGYSADIEFFRNRMRSLEVISSLLK